MRGAVASVLAWYDETNWPAQVADSSSYVGKWVAMWGEAWGAVWVAAWGAASGAAGGGEEATIRTSSTEQSTPPHAAK